MCLISLCKFSLVKVRLPWKRNSACDNAVFNLIMSHQCVYCWDCEKKQWVYLWTKSLAPVVTLSSLTVRLNHRSLLNFASIILRCNWFCIMRWIKEFTPWIPDARSPTLLRTEANDSFLIYCSVLLVIQCCNQKTCFAFCFRNWKWNKHFMNLGITTKKMTEHKIEYHGTQFARAGWFGVELFSRQIFLIAQTIHISPVCTHENSKKSAKLPAYFNLSGHSIINFYNVFFLFVSSLFYSAYVYVFQKQWRAHYLVSTDAQSHTSYLLHFRSYFDVGFSLCLMSLTNSGNGVTWKPSWTAIHFYLSSFILLMIFLFCCCVIATQFLSHLLTMNKWYHTPGHLFFSFPAFVLNVPSETCIYWFP